MLTEVNRVRLLGLLTELRVITADSACAFTGSLRTDDGVYGSHNITIPPDAVLENCTRARLERAAACGDRLWAYVEGCLRSAPRSGPPSPKLATVLVGHIRVLNLDDGATERAEVTEEEERFVARA